MTYAVSAFRITYAVSAFRITYAVSAFRITYVVSAFRRTAGRYSRGNWSAPHMVRQIALRLLLVLAVILVHQVDGKTQPPAGRPQAIFDRAVADFRSGRIAESVAGFDALAKLVPDDAPQLWQRGIALYYLGRYQDCRAQ